VRHCLARMRRQPPWFRRLSAKTDGSGYGRRDRRNHGRKPDFSDGQRRGFLNRSDGPAGQLVEAGAVPLLRPWRQGRQAVVREAFESLLAGSAGTPTTVEASMLIEKLGEELPGGRLECGVGGSPDLLHVPPRASPTDRIAVEDGCHVPAPASWRTSGRLHEIGFLQAK
jgi:hypothetical protein